MNNNECTILCLYINSAIHNTKPSILTEKYLVYSFDPGVNHVTKDIPRETNEYRRSKCII